MTNSPLLEVRGLTVRPRADFHRSIVSDMSFSLEAGECLAVIGESGAGKSLALRAVCGLLPPCLRAEGSVRIQGREVFGRSAAALGCGQTLLYLTQQPMTAFDPLSRLGDQLEETLRLVARRTSAEARRQLTDAFNALGFDAAQEALDKYPCELSGGMLQRAMLALALLLKPRIIIADEPTSALDALSTRRVTQQLLRIRRETGASLMLVTHDLGFAAALADRVIVMRGGCIVESGGKEVFCSPQSAYARHLVEMRSTLDQALLRALGVASNKTQRSAVRNPTCRTPLVKVRGLRHGYACATSRRRREVLRDISLDIASGEVVGLVGPSGAGKSTLSRILLGLEEPQGGTVLISGMSPLKARTSCPGIMSVVFQNYSEAADPMWTVSETVLEPQQLMPANQRPRLEVDALLKAVSLPKNAAKRLPNNLSGGELQRVSIARALAARPDFIVFDEALSSLDASVQAEILRLLPALKAQNPSSAWLFITHDLRAAAAVCSRILFLEDGRIVESLSTNRLFEAQSVLARSLIESSAQAPGVPNPWIFRDRY